MQRSQERRGPREVALGLCNTRLFREGIHVVRYDIENLIELSQGFGETTKTDIGIRVLGEQINVARVEPLGFDEVGLAAIPLAPPPRDISERLRNPAAIRQKLTCSLKVMHRGVVIFQAKVVVSSLGQYSLAKVGLQSERGFGCLPCLFAQGDRWLKTLCEVAARINI